MFSLRFSTHCWFIYTYAFRRALFWCLRQCQSGKALSDDDWWGGLPLNALLNSVEGFDSSLGQKQQFIQKDSRPLLSANVVEKISQFYVIESDWKQWSPGSSWESVGKEIFIACGIVSIIVSQDDLGSILGTNGLSILFDDSLASKAW